MSIFSLLPLGFPHPPGATQPSGTSPDSLASRALTPTRPASHTLHSGDTTRSPDNHTPGLWLWPHAPPCRWARLGWQDLRPERSTCPFPCRGRTWARWASAPPLSSGPCLSHLCRCTPIEKLHEQIPMLDGGWASWPALPSRLIQTERGPHPAALFALHPLATVHEIDRGGGGGLFFFFFPPISLLVQPQKVPYHCRMSGHTLPAGLATLDSPLIDFALPPWGSTNWCFPLGAVIP